MDLLKEELRGSPLLEGEPVDLSFSNLSTWACLFSNLPQVSVILNEKGNAVSSEVDIWISDTYPWKSSLTPLPKYPISLAADICNGPCGASEYYDIGSTLNVSCIVLGSYPTRNMSWYLNGKLIDDS